MVNVDRLAVNGLARACIGKDVFSGDYFVFLNRARNRCKILSWDRDGFVLWAKRLERGRFQRPSSPAEADVVEIDTTTLAMILGGIDLNSTKRRKRYQLPAPAGVDTNPTPLITLPNVSSLQPAE